MRDEKLDILFEPLRMSNLELKNRFFMAPMGTGFSMEQTTDYLVARAKGDVALITTGIVSVHPSGGGIGEAMRLETDDDITPMVGMIKAVQKAGAKIVVQLNHVGRYASSKFIGQQAVAPSAVPCRMTRETPRALSTQEVDDMVICYAEAARRAREAGFDGIEIMGSTGYLIAQFLSPFTNKREDKYGGDVLQRGTFLFSILEETRKRVGDDYNICIKFDADDGVEGGKVLEDSLILAPKMVEAGTDRLHIWAGWHESTRPMLPMFVPRGNFSSYSAAIKSVVDVPVSTVGRINDPYVAADILREKKADLIGLGRPLLCDPEFVLKTREGRDEEIRRCMACCFCFDQIMGGGRLDDGPIIVRCGFNAELGREGEAPIQPASRKKNVVVVGAGPAGLEVSRVAAMRGHKVALYDEKDTLGGLANLAYLPPHKEELKNCVDYYKKQLEVLNVDLHLGESVTSETLREKEADVLVLATGADELIPDIPGIDKDNVVSALEVLEEKTPVGDPVVVIGGGLIGVETAEFLSDKGKSVTVIEMLKSVATDLGPTIRWGTLMRIRQKISILTLTKVIEVSDTGVVVEGQDGKRDEIPAGTVVLAAGMCSRMELDEAAEAGGMEYRVVGSCKKPGFIVDAIHDAFQVGCEL